ncbi:MAG TPA: 3-dehydroquinate synthase [Tenuifilaceae bacterium]|jgi:3-dehydroquinate synthase|nr:3-dehydroquinate synthase [Bacteroidota bacterium]MZP83270.1 3-dehydroquinate synthase [Bacteroidales bacterium]NLH55562.1 3-dehydroquinate synthase [Rikenellaceae bacterium]HNV81740.1 3-dehydroquinate synthase [Tenuifilaceae bacterium]HOF92253.1 3-dehydroquinate synthase [Tenuifilaceae bacterium]
MEVVINALSGRSRVIIGDTFQNLANLLPHEDVFVITDGNVYPLLGQLKSKYPTHTITPGESSKSLGVAQNIYEWLLEKGAHRRSFILGFGGGVVCDIAGFVASTYMRGIHFGFVATSLLAQVDASVGGKNGLNLDGYKNIIGTFKQPEFVICDVLMLKTLPNEELANGFAEIVKHTLIADAKMFGFIEENVEGLLNRNGQIIEKLVEHSVRVKARIVQADEFEKGERKKLNLGHTWGHAVEKLSGLPHGQSVSIGLEFAARLSLEKGLLDAHDYQRLINLLQELRLPTVTTLNPLQLFDALTRDKKKIADSVDFILMKGIGEVVIERLTLTTIKNFLVQNYK